MEETEKYAEEFEELIVVAFFGILGRELESWREHSNWGIALHNEIVNIRDQAKKQASLVPVNLAELRQELHCQWLEYTKKYNESRPNVHIKTYLIRRSCWGLRDWYKRQVLIPRSGPVFSVKDNEIENLGFQLDIGFLLYGTKFSPLSILTPYERYLIFLKYYEEKTILEMSYIVQKSSSHVKRELRTIINRLKELVD